MDLAQIQGWLPDGWQAEEVSSHPNLVALMRPRTCGGGYVTLDFKLRIFDAGYARPRQHAPSAKNTGGRDHYSGRRWQQQLTEDAVAWLDGVMA